MMIVDNEYKFPMQYPTKENGRIVMKRSDHLTLIFKLKNIPTNKSGTITEKRASKWNFNRKGGWETYKAIASS